MSKVKLTVTKSNCRCGYVKAGDTFIVDDLCPPLCHELWNTIYPSVYALKNGAVLDYGSTRAGCFDAMCPDECRVHIHGEAIQEQAPDNRTGNATVYYKDEKLIIRDMEKADAQVFTDEFTAQGWHPEIAGYLARLSDQAEGRCIALTAVYEGYPAGYVYVYLQADGGPFKEKGWPIIVDFNVLMKYQRKGIGNRLMDVAEQVAGRYADTVCLGVGLCDSYGTAQRMYVKRGYIPDGSGVWYQDKQCVQYETVCTVDDDLILFFSKKLSE